MRREGPRMPITFDDLFSDEPLSKNLYATVEGDSTYVELHLTPDAKMDRLEDMMDVAEGLRVLPRFLQSPVCRNVQNVVITSWVVTKLSSSDTGKKLPDRFGFEVREGASDSLQAESAKRYAETMAKSRFSEYVPNEYKDKPSGHARIRHEKLRELKTMKLNDDVARFNDELHQFFRSVGIDPESEK